MAAVTDELAPGEAKVPEADAKSVSEKEPTAVTKDPAAVSEAPSAGEVSNALSEPSAAAAEERTPEVKEPAVQASAGAPPGTSEAPGVEPEKSAPTQEVAAEGQGSVSAATKVVTPADGAQESKSASGPETESSFLDALDAPPGHEAFVRVRYIADHKWPLAHFTYPLTKVRFQATLQAAGSDRAAEVIARACYVRFEHGDSVEDVKKFRQDCYNRLTAIRTGIPVGEKKQSGKRKAFQADLSVNKVPPVNGSVQATPPPLVDKEVDKEKKEKKEKKERKEEKEKKEENEEKEEKKLNREKDDRDDAPGSSAAWSEMKYDKNNGQFFFIIGQATGDKLDRRKFTVSVRRVGGDTDEAARLARLLFVQFENGSNKDEVSDMRTTMFAPFISAPEPDEETKRSWMLSAAVASLQGKRKSPEDAVQDADAKRVKVEKPVKVEPALKQELKQEVKQDVKQEVKQEGKKELQDAPVGHPSWDKVKLKLSPTGRSSSVALFFYEFPDGNKQRFQVTVKAAANDPDQCIRIARLCYMKFEEGMPKSEVEEYRKQLCIDVGGNPGKADTVEPSMFAPVKNEDNKEKEKNKEKKAPKSLAGSHNVMEKLRKLGRLTGAVEIKGRDPAARNATINGVYCSIPAGFGGLPAYEKFTGATGTSDRFLFYSTRKNRWKVNDDLDDSKGGYAYARSQEPSVPSDPMLKLKWFVFDGKEKGYNEDASVSCDALDKDEQATAKKVEEDEKKEKPNHEVKAEELEEGDQDSSASSDDSDCSDSAGSRSSGATSSDAEDEDDAGEANAAATGEGPIVAPPASAAVEQQAAAPLPVPIVKPKGRVCAKLLARSFLRCKCHFSYMKDCPTARANSRGAAILTA